MGSQKDAKDGDDTDTQECIEMYTGPQGQVHYDPELREIAIFKTVGNQKEPRLFYRGSLSGIELSETSRYGSCKGHDTFETLTSEQLDTFFDFGKDVRIFYPDKSYAIDYSAAPSQVPSGGSAQDWYRR